MSALQKRKNFSEKIRKYLQIKIYDFEVWSDSNNKKLLSETAKKLKIKISGAPFTFIGEKLFIDSLVKLLEERRLKMLFYAA